MRIIIGYRRSALSPCIAYSRKYGISYSDQLFYCNMSFCSCQTQSYLTVFTIHCQIAEPNTPAILRQACAAYVASFIARAKYISIRYSCSALVVKRATLASSESECDVLHWNESRLISVKYTAISRKVVGKNVYGTIPKGKIGYD